MTVLLKLNDEYRVENGDKEAQAKAAFGHVSSVYADCADVSDAYLYDPETDYAENLNFIDGKDTPEKVLEIAEGWNSNIQATFGTALRKMQASIHWTTGKYLAMPSTLIYDVKKAAMALDNDFYAFADRALLVNRSGYMTTVLHGHELDAIRARPQDYAVIEVTPK